MSVIKGAIVLFVSIPMVVAIFISLIGGPDLVLDEFHLAIIKNDIKLLDDLHDPILQYPVYDYSVRNSSTYFRVNSNKRFANYLESTNIYQKTYTDDDYIIYLLADNNTEYYLVHQQETNEYSLMKNTIGFYKNTIYDGIPLVPCSYFENLSFWQYNNTTGTYETEYSWDQVKAFYQQYGDEVISASDLDNQIVFRNDSTRNAFLITYHDNTITIQRLDT